MQGAAGRRALFLEDGQFTGSSSTHDDDRLGQVLWRTGLVPLDQVLIATEMAKQGKMLGRVLVELGFLEPAALRKGLLQQAVLVFEAACLEDTGVAVFEPDLKHPSPIRFGVSTSELIARSLERVAQHRALARELGDLSRPLKVDAAGAHPPLTDPEQAMLQLAASTQGRPTGRSLVDKSGLGDFDGLRALAGLIGKGLLKEAAPASRAEDVVLRVRRLVAAVNLVMAALDDAGFGVGDAVREYVANPPAQFEEALSGISLDGPLDEDAALQHAQFVTGGAAAIAAALKAVLEDALMQARDTLPPELTTKLEERVAALTGA